MQQTEFKTLMFFDVGVFASKGCYITILSMQFEK